jgi:phage shock protein PspC (stress-responsive transcriptional regulator)/predicted membrane protein
LRRDREHRVLGGVASGIARTYGIDVTLVRVLWIIAAFLWFGIPAYLVAWIAIPPGEGEASLGDQPRDIGMLIGVALVGIGALIAVEQVLPHGLRGGRFVAPLLLIGGGIAILVLRRPSEEIEIDAPVAATPPDPPLPSSPAPTVEAPAFIAPTLSGAADAPTAPQEPVTAWTQTAPWPTKQERRMERRARRRRRPRPFLTPLAVSLLLLYAGVVSFLAAIDAITVNVTVVLAIATLFVGAVLLLSTWVGRARGLIFIGLLLVAATAISTAIDVPLQGGVGEHVYTPHVTSDIQDPYKLGVGHLLIDLRDLALVEPTTVVNAQLGVGNLEVKVPNNAQIEVQAHAGAGNLRLFGHDNGGWDNSDHRIVYRAGAPVLRLNLKVGAGQVQVRRFEQGDVELIGGSS